MGSCQAKEAKIKGIHGPCDEKHTNGKIVGKNGQNIAVNSSPRIFDSSTGVEEFLYSFLGGAEAVLGDKRLFSSSNEKHYVCLTFLNSCVDVTRTKFRLRAEIVVGIIRKVGVDLKLKTILKTLPFVRECCVDDGFSRILYAWLARNMGFLKTGSDFAGGSTTDSRRAGKYIEHSGEFSNILYSHLHSAIDAPLMDVFLTHSQGKEIITVGQYGKFLREMQCAEMTDSQVEEKYRYRFGGVIHRFNFNTYMGSLLTNSALDPLRTTNVWQDMTQPLTRYLINSRRIESENDLEQALSDGSRAFVLQLREDETGVLCSGTCSLQTIVTAINKSGFIKSQYPIILCLSPATKITLEQKKRVADIIKDGLWSLLAKGLMFEGAIISDPKFSPAAQRKKVLVLGYQSRLKPFIGSLVADMARDGLGVRVTSVIDASPAAKSGIAIDDWLTHINGEAIQNKQHLREKMAKLLPGEELTLRRENLEEIKIIVGGIVDKDDKSESAELSDLLFLKYTEGKTSNPWEAQILTEKTIFKSRVCRKDLDDHFAFFSAEDEFASLGDIDFATAIGVQLIDTKNVREARVLAKGRFIDNGCSGYLIKNDFGEEGLLGVTLEIIAGPQEIKGFALKDAKARLHGVGSVYVEANKFIFNGCNDATVAVIDYEFAQNDVSVNFVAAFPLSLLRFGYRVLPLEQTGGAEKVEVSTPCAYCYISRNM